jgi:hypothetical protein
MMEKVKELLLKVKPSPGLTKVALVLVGITGVSISPEASELIADWLGWAEDTLRALHADVE